MSETPKKISEEELEKQYEDYRAQFEQWKENNKSSVGTDAYNSYVAQFEQWEKEVEARKALQRNHRKAQMMVVDDKEAEAAAAYAQSQEAYMSHHVKAMEQQEMNRAVAASAHHHHHPHHFAATIAATNQPPQQHQVAAAAEVFVPPRQQQQPVPPTLWGNPRPVYDARDPLFAKWGDRAATTHTRPEMERAVNPVACWMLLDTLRDKKMVLAPHLV